MSNKNEQNIQNEQSAPINLTSSEEQIENDINIEETDSKPSESDLPEVHHEDSLELHYMSRKQRMAAKRTKFKKEIEDMSPIRKFGHFLRYYKWLVIIPALVIFFGVAIFLTVRKNNQPIGLSYLILNVKDEEVVDTSFYTDYASTFELSDNYREQKVLNYHIDYATYLEREDIFLSSSGTDYAKVSESCSAGNYDVVLTDMDGLKFCCRIDIVQVLSNTLEPDVYALLEPYIVYVDGPYGQETFALDISGTDFSKNLNVGYDKMYLAIPNKTAGKGNDNALRLIEYIYGIDVFNN